MPDIEQAIQRLGEPRSVIDLFSGTSRVGHHLKKCGYQVFSNDINTYAFQIATCYVVSDKEDHNDIPELIAHMNTIEGKEGYFTETFCKSHNFFNQRMVRKSMLFAHGLKNKTLVLKKGDFIDSSSWKPLIELILLVGFKWLI